VDVPEGISLVIIAGRHANANLYTIDQLDGVKKLIEKAVFKWQDGGDYNAEVKVFVIVSDGKPSKTPIAIEGTANPDNPLKVTMKNDRARTNELNDVVIPGIINFLRSDTLRADNEGVDLLGAISEAQTILELNPGKENHILILDTGICTTGAFNMDLIRLQDGTPDDVVNKISAGGFPKLGATNTKVTFWGLGNVAEPQLDLRSDSTFKTQLIDVWTKIIVEKCGATLTQPILFSESAGEPMMWVEDGSGYPYVRPVLFSVVKPPEPPKQEDPPPPPPEVFAAAALGFEPDSSAFRDERQARELIGSKVDAIYKYICAYPDKTVYIVGSIARTSSGEATAKHNWLAKERAQKVAEILIKDYNIPSERLVVIDAGTTEFSWRPGKEFVNGVKNPQNQQSSRVVAIIAEDSTEKVDELRKAGYLN